TMMPKITTNRWATILSSFSLKLLGFISFMILYLFNQSIQFRFVIPIIGIHGLYSFLKAVQLGIGDGHACFFQYLHRLGYRLCPDFVFKNCRLIGSFLKPLSFLIG